MKKNKSKTKGFTLIELLVALGVFMVVMTMTLSAFLNIIDIQKKTEAFRKVNDNLNFAMEAMMREIREGKDYCPFGCAGGTFSFINKDGLSVNYQLNVGHIERQVPSKSANWLMLTSDEIVITNLSFSAKGNAAGDKQQPLVTIAIGGESGLNQKLKSKLNLQATVSQRKLDPL